jgi:hypothetical protein
MYTIITLAHFAWEVLGAFNRARIHFGVVVVVEVLAVSLKVVKMTYHLWHDRLLLQGPSAVLDWPEAGY